MTTLEKIARAFINNDAELSRVARKMRECQIHKARIAALLSDELKRIERKRMGVVKVKP